MVAKMSDRSSWSSLSCCAEGCREVFKPVNNSSSLTRLQKSLRLVLSIALGQVLSLLLCGTGITAQLLVCWYSVSIPASQAFINYFLLGVFYGIPLAVRKDVLTVLKMHWWKYIILGVIDVEANYLVILAYRYTSLSSIQILDSFAITCVMLLSFVFLRTRYKIINFMGVSLSLIGIASLVLADLNIAGCRSTHASNKLLGDLLCLAGVALYAVGNVAQEYLVKKHTITEYLGLIGVVGSIVSAVQLLVLERRTVAKIEWNQSIGFLLFGFGLIRFVFYSVIPHAMRISSALVVNLSLLTADFYSVLFGVFIFHFKLTPLYILSFILIICGVLIYNLRTPGMGEKDENKDTGDSTENKTDQPVTSDANVPNRLLESQSMEMSESRTSSRGLEGGHYGSVD